jgi:hypothetical protein
MGVSLRDSGFLRAWACPFDFSPSIAGMTAHGTFRTCRRIGKHTVELDSRKLPLDLVEERDLVSKLK